MYHSPLTANKLHNALDVCLQTVDHLIFKCKKLSNQRNEMIQQIKSTGGNWLAKNETLIKNYLNFFVKFVKSIELIDLK